MKKNVGIIDLHRGLQNEAELLQELAFRGFDCVGLRWWCMCFPGDAEVTRSVRLGIASMDPFLFSFFLFFHFVHTLSDGS